MRSLLALTSALLFLPIAQAAEKMNVLFIVSDDLMNNALQLLRHPVVQVAEHRQARRQGREVRPGVLPVPAVQPEPGELPHRPAAGHDEGVRERHPVPQERAGRPEPAADVPQGRVLRRPRRQAVPLRRARRRSAPTGSTTRRRGRRSSTPAAGTRTTEDRHLHPQPRTGRAPAGSAATLSWLAAEGTDAEQTDGKIAAEVVKLLEANKDRPFFLACGFFRPHTPYVSPKKYFDLYPADKIVLPQVPAGPARRRPRPRRSAATRRSRTTMTDDLRRQAIQAYYASTSFMDAQVGRRARRPGAARSWRTRRSSSSISDHGYHLGEHGLWQKMSLFENSARVPLVIYDPRSKGNGKASSADGGAGGPAPDAGRALRADGPGRTDGASLKPLLDDPAAEWDRPAYHAGEPGHADGHRREAGQGQAVANMGRSVRTERYRYTEWDGGRKGVQLYDYETDPQELTNLAADPEERRCRETDEGAAEGLILEGFATLRRSVWPSHASPKRREPTAGVHFP